MFNRGGVLNSYLQRLDEADLPEYFEVAQECRDKNILPLRDSNLPENSLTQNLETPSWMVRALAEKRATECRNLYIFGQFELFIERKSY